VSNQNRKHKLFEVDRSERAARRSKLRTVKQVNSQEHNGEKITRKNEYQTSQDDAETRQVLVEAAQSFIETIEFYKKDFGDPMSHDEAVAETLRIYESRRNYVAGLQPQEVTWGHVAAVAEANTDDALTLWARVRKAADDELESGKRGAEVAGHNANPYERARYLAIRDAFADQWRPQGGIESAMIEMMAVAFSLQLYWCEIAHDRAIRVCDAQSEASKRYASSGWKLPYQSEADAVDQAHQLADGYNRQFLRVLRQLRDLRRYAPVVIQNAQQVNVGNQQVNVSA
jgi:hypothetical protein